jgi:beta-1,4-N-acetylglucosaminyltransferase
MRTAIKILAILGKGGHTTQMLRLLGEMPKDFEYSYVICHEDPISEKKVDGTVYKVNMPSREGDSKFMKIVRTLRTIFQGATALIKDNPHVVISAGPGVGVIFSYIGKFLGKKVVFIESWARVYSKSDSGKLVYPIADLFFVQWKEMKKVYPNSIYAGRLG